GAFSEVKIGVSKETGAKYAIKIVDRSKCKGKEDMVETEVKILKMIRHQNIVQLYEMYEFDGKIYLVMELVTGGELFDEIMGRGTFGEKDAAKIVQKILLAIQYLHSMGIVHRDLKPENLLLSDKSSNPEIKISDFGLSKIFTESEVMKTACGTPGYVGRAELLTPAPEVLKKRGYGPQVDLWSLGVITYILLCGYPPFFDSSNPELFRKIMAGRFQFDRPWWDNISDQGTVRTGLTLPAKDFVCKLLIVEPQHRWNAAQALSHPFITNNCFPPPPTHAPPAQPALSTYIHKPIPHKFMFASPPTTTVTDGAIYDRPTVTQRQAPSPAYDIPLKPLKPLSRDTAEASAAPGAPVPAHKPQFSSKVNRIASWFRAATVVEKHGPSRPI
ncbi:hypothetical protein HDV03_001056, partial [Kappamyces sp. JEL0829]